MLIYQNGKLIASKQFSPSTGTDSNGSMIINPRTLNVHGAITLAENIGGKIQVVVRIGAFNDTGAGATGNSKTYTINMDIPFA